MTAVMCQTERVPCSAPVVHGVQDTVPGVHPPLVCNFIYDDCRMNTNLFMKWYIYISSISCKKQFDTILLLVTSVIPNYDLTLDVNNIMAALYRL